MTPKNRTAKSYSNSADVQEELVDETKDETVREVTEEENSMMALLILLEDYGTTEDQISTWKSNYGFVYVSQVHEDGPVFLWKKMNRAEYRQILESGATAKEMSYQDAVLRKCMLAPKADHGFLATSDAGLIPTLFTQIMYQSGFVPDNMALALINEV